MRPLIYVGSGFALFALAAAVLVGCRPAEPQRASPPSAVESPPADLPRDVAAQLAALPEGDRELAIEQRVCPVTGELLGSMGPPVRVSVEGRDVLICCAACEDALRQQPQRYLETLP